MPPSTWEVVRSSQYRSMPWRNGKGTTLEVAREPAAGDAFDWRLSLATISSDGAWSSYPGCERLVALVSGNGFRLEATGEGRKELTPASRLARFPGDAPTTCTLLDDSCTDLSLIVSRPGAITASQLLAIDAATDWVCGKEQAAALYCLEGAVRAIASDGREERLSVSDCLLVPEGADPRLRLLGAGDGRCQLISLHWRRQRP